VSLCEGTLVILPRGSHLVDNTFLVGDLGGQLIGHYLLVINHTGLENRD
jgi:hypothetical protein